MKIKKEEVNVRKDTMTPEEVIASMIKAMDNLFSNMKMFKAELDMCRVDLLKSHQKIKDLEWEVTALKVALGFEEESTLDYVEAKEVEPFTVEIPK